MRTFWLLYKSEAKLSFREMSSFIFGLILPLGLMALLGAFGESNEDLNRSFAAVATIGLVSSGVMSLPLSLSSYRERKILKRYQVTPISPAHLLSAHVTFCFSLSIVSMIGVFLIAKLGFGMEFLGSGWLFIGAYLITMISIHSIGMVIASLSPREKTTGAISSAIYFPMFLLSGATIPIEIMPDFLQTLAKIFPLTYGIEWLKGIALHEPGGYALHITVLVGVALLGILISIRTFRWE